MDTDNPEFSHINYIIEVSGSLPSDFMTTRLGDCINNFRSVLDHLVWESSVSFSGSPPPFAHRIWFPSSASNTTGLHAVDPALLLNVANHFANSAPGQPGDPNPLELLCQLSNVDKHPTNHAILHYVRSVEITTDPVIFGTVVHVNPDIQELLDQLVIAEVAIPRPVGFREAIDIHCHTMHGIAIAETDRTPVVHLGLSLEAIETAVLGAVSALGPHIP
ncbi:MAG: hypothetical protein WA786_06885 [Acidimicrobiales bacterium]